MGSGLRRGLFVLLGVLLVACESAGPPPEDTRGYGFVLAPRTNGVVLSDAGTQQTGAALLDVDVVATGGFDGDVRFETGSAPNGLRATIDTRTPGQGATLRFEATTLEPGLYELELKANAGAARDTVRVGVVRPGGTAGWTADAESLRGRVTTANASIGTSAVPLASADVAVPEASPFRPLAPYVPGEVVVQYRVDAPSGGVELQSSLGLTVVRAGAPGEPSLLAAPGDEDVEALAARLRADPRVAYAEPNYYLFPASNPHAAGMPDDPRLGEQWSLAAIGAPVAWTAGGADAPVVVAVLDTGFDLTHEDLAARLLPGRDFCPVASGPCPNGDASSGNASNGSRGNYHGTHVAGLIGAIGGNGRGVAGVLPGANVRILPVKVFNDMGEEATLHTFVRGLRWAVGLEVAGAPRNPHPAQVVNVSLGGYFTSGIVQAAVNDALAQDAVIVAAAGNHGIDVVMSPASAEGVLAVGAVNRSLELACFSNHGPRLDFVAPGGDGAPVARTPGQPRASATCSPSRQSLVSTIPGSAYAGATGTSMAAPLVAGVAALVRAAEPGLSRTQVEARLRAGAYFDDAWMSRDRHGAGVIRADRALGLPGPGDVVGVQVGTPDGGRSVAAVTLDAWGGSSAVSLPSTPAGTLEAVAVGARRALYGQVDGVDGERGYGMAPQGSAAGEVVIPLFGSR